MTTNFNVRKMHCFVERMDDLVNFLMETPQQINVKLNVDVTPIRQRGNNDKFPQHFDVLFLCNFDEQNVDVAST